jgi:hypothetical protein
MKKAPEYLPEIVIYGKESYLTFSSSGALESLHFQGGELLQSARNLFTLYVLDTEGKRHELSSSEFLRQSFEKNVWSFGKYPEFPELEVRVAIRVKDDQYFFRPSVHNIPVKWLLERIESPQPVVSSSGKLFSPYSEGVLVHNPISKNFITREFKDI